MRTACTRSRQLAIWSGARTLRFAPALLTAMAAVGLTAAPRAAHAADDRVLQEITNSWWLRMARPAEIDSVIEATGGRLVELEVVRTEPLQFAAVFIENAGAYHHEWRWVAGSSLLNLVALAGTPGVRIIDFERYVDPTANNQVRYAAIVVTDEDPSLPAWSIQTGVTNLPAALAAAGARPVDFEGYDEGSVHKYDILMEADPQPSARPWWLLQNVSRAQVEQFQAEHNGQVLELQVRNTSQRLVDAMIIANDGPNAYESWWVAPVNSAQLAAQQSMYGARVSALEIYFPNTVSGPSFAAVLVRNCDDTTARIASMLGYGTDGSTGAYLQEINGPTLVSIQPTVVFEPASSIKSIALLHSLREVMLGHDSLDSAITFSVNMDNTCPIGGDPFETVTLEEALRRMMEYSDNAATLGVISRYGAIPINDTAHLVAGMPNTWIRHQPIGCYPQMLAANWMTLADAGQLFSRVATATILDVPMRDKFFHLMLSDDDGYQYWFAQSLLDIVYEEAMPIGGEQLGNLYWDALRYSWKPGSYWIGSTWFNSAVGWVSLPKWDGPDGYGATEYAFGTFVHGATYPGDRAWAAGAEMFRELIRADLANFPTAAPPMAVVAQPVLEPNYPNPFNPRTTLAYTLPESGWIRLAVYDVRGRLVTELARHPAAAGRYSVEWDGKDSGGSDVASGTYLIRLETPSTVRSRPVTLIR